MKRLMVWVHDQLTARKMTRVFGRGKDPYDYLASPYERARLKSMINILKSRRFGRVLELGCGEGIFSEMLLDQSDNLSALDISETALARARTRLEPWAGRVRFIRDNARSWVAGSRDSYSLIVASEFLYYLGEKGQKGPFFEQAFENFLSDLFRILEPRGWILLAHGFTNEQEFEVRRFYGKRLLNRGLKIMDSRILGDFAHDKGSLRSLIELYEK